MVFPLLAAATLGAGALSALSGNSAAKKAAAASNYATDQQIALQKAQYDQTRADLAPYTEAGAAGLSTLQDRAGGEGGVYGYTANPTYATPQAFNYGANDYQESPGLKIAIERGIDAINSNMANRGALYSGAAMKSIGQFVADTQAKDFQNERNFAYGQYNDAANRARNDYVSDRDYLSGRYDTQTGVATNLASLGQSAAAGQANAGMNYANNAGNAYQQNASNIANAGLVQSSNLSNLLGQGLNAYAYGQSRDPSVPESYVPKGNGTLNGYTSSLRYLA